jgi:hypothetical protein
MSYAGFGHNPSLDGQEIIDGLRASITRFFKVSGRQSESATKGSADLNKNSAIIGDQTYFIYEIIVTNPSPFNRWLVHRRYNDFRELYKHFKIKCGRRLHTQFPGKSLISSGSALAEQRVPSLEDFLFEVLSIPDLTVKEIDRLYSFLEVRKNCFEVEPGDNAGDASDMNLDDDLDDEPSFEVDDIDGSDMNRMKSRSVEKICVKEAHDSMRYSDVRETIDLGSGSPHARYGAGAVRSYSIESNSLNRTYAVTAEGMKEALRNNDLPAVREMLQKSKSLATDIDDAGNPVIYTAALYGSIDLALELITAGADPFVKNRQGITAMEVAFEPWKIAVQEYMAELERLKADENSPFQEFVAEIPKDANGSLGLNIVKSREGLPVIFGFKSRSNESAVPATASVVMPNDLIIGVNDCASKNFEDLVSAMKSSVGVVRLRIRREKRQDP